MKSSKAKLAASSAARLPTGDRALGARIKRARGKMSQEALAKKIGLTKGAISSFENGHTLPTIQTAIKIAGALNVAEAEIFGVTSGRPASQAVLDGMTLDDRISALPEAMREFVLLSLKRAEAAARAVPEKFLRPPTSENWGEFADYLESISMKSPNGDP